jgi:hypothetical protein
MGFLTGLFGPSKDEIWGQLAAQIGGEYEDGGWLGRDVLRVRVAGWEITIDTFTRSSGKSSQTYTRMRAPFLNKDGLRFTVYRSNLFSGIGKWFGLQDIEVGDPFFDKEFIIKSNAPDKVRRLLADDRLKQLIAAQPAIHFEVKDDEGWFGATFPDGVDELYFECRWVIKDEQRLRHLFELFALTLERLVQLDSAYPDDPNVQI